MKRKYSLIIGVLIIAAFIFYYFVFNIPASKESQVREDKGQLQVITSISILKDFVEGIGGERVKVESLITGLETPHTFSLAPSDRKKILAADMIVRIGLGLEVWINEILTDLPKDTLLITTADAPGIRVIGQGEDGQGGNPHIWLDPANAKLMVNEIKKGLIKLDPGHRDYYEENCREYLARIDLIVDRLKLRVNSLDNRKVFSYSAAFPYLLDAFNFISPIPVQIVPGQQISARQVTEIIKKIQQEGIGVIIETRQASSNMAQMIADETGGKLVYLTPLLIPLTIPATKSYPELIEYNVEALIEALQPAHL